MARRGSSARAVALRRAQQAKADRDAARLSREKDIEAALADYFEAIGQAEQVRREARRKSDRLLASAELAAQAPLQAARAAVHRMRELLGSATEVGSLCGITASEVRAMLAPPAPGIGPHEDPAEVPHADAAVGGDPEQPAVPPDPPPASPPGDDLYRGIGGAPGR